MAALKLFISHSSIRGEANEQGDHLDLLDGTCQALRTCYGEDIDILVDREGLTPACNWKDRLFDWLGECDAAIVLFSKKALEDSHWVRFEAAVLRWRAYRDPAFVLIPVLLKSEADPVDLEQGFWRAIDIGAKQCVRSAAKPERILAELEPSLGEAMREVARSNGFGRRFAVIRSLMAEHKGEANDHGKALRAAWEKVAGPDDHPPTWPTDPVGRYSLALTRYLFHEKARQPDAVASSGTPGFSEAIPRLMEIMRHMHPPFLRPQLLRDYVLPLWVDERAAQKLDSHQLDAELVALNGKYVLLTDADYHIENFTLHRYYQRANLSVCALDCVPPPPAWTHDQIRDAIRTRIDKCWPSYDEDEVADLDGDIYRRKPPLYLVFVAQDTGLPSEEELLSLLVLRRTFCPALRIVFATGKHLPVKQDHVHIVEPELDTRIETRQLRHERELRDVIPGKWIAP